MINIENFDSKFKSVVRTKEWKELSLGCFDIHDFKIKEELFLIDIKKIK